MTELTLVALGEWSIRAAGLVGVTATLLWMLRVKDVQVRLAVWTAVLAGLMLMPVAMLITEPIPLWIGAETPTPPVFAQSTVPVDLADPGATAATVAPRVKLEWSDVFVLAWLIGAGVLLARVLLGLRLAAKLRKTSREVDDGVFESDAVHVPVTVGMLRPVVILPSDWRGWDEDKLRAVLAHERAHVARRDPLRQAMASVFRSIAWFPPLAWWLRSHLTELAELASDDAAVSATGDRVVYAETLLGFIQRARGRVRLEGVAMASPRTRARRLERLLDENHRPSCPLSLRGSFMIVMLLAPMVYVGAAMRPQKLEAQSLVLTRPSVGVAPQITVAKPANPGCGVQGPYQKWLEEDVTYIVTRAEREEFLRSITSEQCDAFIARFWQRRPAEMKEEHYRRIAYANERFAWGMPGWRTDRGRIYITHGPPDEIESHPSPGRTYPFEVWRYKWIEGLGEDVQYEFIDSNGTGEYPLTTVRDAEALALLRKPPGQGGGADVSRMPMMLVDPRVILDGKDFGSEGLRAISGYTIYVSVKDVGRFILTLEKRDDARLSEVGSTAGKRIEVEVGGHSLRVECAANVSGGGRMPVYGRLETSYKATRDLEIIGSK